MNYLVKLSDFQLRIQQKSFWNLRTLQVLKAISHINGLARAEKKLHVKACPRTAPPSPVRPPNKKRKTYLKINYLVGLSTVLVPAVVKHLDWFMIREDVWNVIWWFRWAQQSRAPLLAIAQEVGTAEKKQAENLNFSSWAFSFLFT